MFHMILGINKGVSLKSTNGLGFAMGMQCISGTVGTESLILLSRFEQKLRWFTCAGLLLCASHASVQISVQQVASLQKSQICLFKLGDSSLIQKMKSALPGPCSSHYLSLQTVLTHWNGLWVWQVRLFLHWERPASCCAVHGNSNGQDPRSYCGFVFSCLQSKGGNFSMLK